MPSNATLRPSGMPTYVTPTVYPAANSAFNQAVLLTDGQTLQVATGLHAFNGGVPKSIETWFNLSAPLVGSNVVVLMGHQGLSPNASNDWVIYQTSTGTIELAARGAAVAASPVVSQGWRHIAVTYDGAATIRVSVDGTQAVSVTTYAPSPFAGLLDFLGGPSDPTVATNHSVTGGIDDYRASSVVRYSATFTPPSSPFVNDANTLSLVHFDGNLTSADTRDALVVTPTNAAIAGGTTQQFTATPSTGSPAITWSVTNGTGSATISTNGLLTGGSPGAVTVTATATGYASSSVTATVTPVIAPTAPTITLTPTTAGTIIAVTTPAVAGSSPVASYLLKAGTTPGGEGSAALATLPASVNPLQFPAQPAAAAGQVVYYTVQAADNEATPTLSLPSNEVGQKTTSIVPAGQTYTMTVSAPYGPTATGLSATLGYIVYDPTGAVVVPHTTGKTNEIPGTGIYLVAVTLDQAWSGVVVVDAPAGMGQYTQTFDAPSAAASAVTLALNDPTAQRVARALPNAVSGAVGGLPVAQTTPNTLLMDPTQSTAGAAKGTVLGGIRAAESGAIGRKVEAPAVVGATAGPGTLTTYDVAGQVEVVEVINDISAPTTVVPTP